MTITEAQALIAPAFAAPSRATGSPSASNSSLSASTASTTASASTLSPSTPPTWADLGCGSGVFTEALSRLLPPGSIVYGIDTNPTLRPTTNIIPQKADFIKDDLHLHDLNGILMANSLHYVRDKPALLKKLQTYMRPGSPFLIVEYDTDQPVSTWVPFPLSYAALTKLFTTAGYSHIQKLGQRPSAYGRSQMYAAIVSPAS